MQEKDMIVMTTKELKRLYFIRKAIEKEITQKEAAEFCRLSARQIRRIISRIKGAGDRGIIHCSRGKTSNAKYPEKQKQRIINLYKSHYPDFGPTLAQEKLFQIHNIRISDETLRLWLHKEGCVNYRTRKRKPNRIRRERKECFGQMLQMDGSHHDWLEGRGPWLVLMAYIDDATSNVYAEFHDYEGTLPAMTSFHHYVLKYDLPGSVYLDKHSTYKTNQKPSIEDELKGEEFKTQFQRALTALGVDVIHADSPQAKGRVERLFDTFQDRLVKELRLSGAKNKDEANEFLKQYLPIFNRRFRRVPRRDVNLHRKAPSRAKLKQILAIHHECALANDNTVRYEGKIYLIKERLTKHRRHKIHLEKRMDGKIYLLNKNQPLRYKEVCEHPKQIQRKPGKVRKPKRIHIPPQNHLFRRFFIKQESLARSAKNGFTRPDLSRLNAIGREFQHNNEYEHTLKNRMFTYLPYSQRKRQQEPEKEKEIMNAINP